MNELDFLIPALGIVTLLMLTLGYKIWYSGEPGHTEYKFDPHKRRVDIPAEHDFGMLGCIGIVALLIIAVVLKVWSG